MIVAIIDAQGVEIVSNEVTESIPQDILEPAAKVTCEAWNRDHPEDGWEVVVIDTDKESE